MSRTTVKATDHIAVALGKHGRVSDLKDTQFIGRGLAASGFSTMGAGNGGKFTKGAANCGKHISLEQYEALRMSE